MAWNESSIISKGFTELEVWKKMRLLKMKIETLTKTFPDEEKYRLTSEIIRRATGVNAAIAKARADLHFRIEFIFALSDAAL